MVKNYRHWTLAHKVGKKVWKHRNDIKFAWKLAKKFRSFGSSTKTLTNKQEEMKGDDVHSGVTDWSCKIMAKTHSSKNVDFKSGCHQLSESSSGRVIGTAGRAYVVMVGAFATASQQLVSSSIAATNLAENPQLGVISYLDLNPNRTATGSTNFAAVTKHSTERIFVKGHHFKLSLVNTSSVGQSVWIYVVKSKMVSHNPVNVNYTRLLEGAGKYLNASAVAGIAPGTKVGGTVGYFANESYDHFSPFALKEFGRQYKLLKCHRVNLAGAAQEDLNFSIEHDYMVNPRRFITTTLNVSNDPASWTSGNLGDVMYPAGCVQIMMVVRGGLVVDETAGTVHNPTLAAPSVGWLYHKKTTCYPVKDSGQRYETREGVVQIPDGVAAADQKQVDIVDAVAAVETLP